jgi:hypothetical protein
VDFKDCDCGTVAGIDGMFAVMIVTIGIAFLLAMPGLIGFSADMQQGFAITGKNIQAQDIGKAIMFSEEGAKAAIAYSVQPPPDDGTTPSNGTFTNKTSKQWLQTLGINYAYNDFDVYMRMSTMQKNTPVLRVHDDIESIFNASSIWTTLTQLWLWIKKNVYNLSYDFFVGGERHQGRFNTQITTDNGIVVLTVIKGSVELTNSTSS